VSRPFFTKESAVRTTETEKRMVCRCEVFQGAPLTAGLMLRPVNKTAPELADLRVSLCRGQLMNVRAESAIS